MKDYKAFTATCNTIATKLINEINIISNGNGITVLAQWDTGATCSCISQEVIKQLKLTPVGKATILTSNHQSLQDTYQITVSLPNHVNIVDILVIGSRIGEQGIGMLIGMDIIRFGDFAISNYNGKTTFSFRVPSISVTDYVDSCE